MILTIGALLGGFLIPALLGLPVFFSFLLGSLLAIWVDPVLTLDITMSPFYYQLNNFPLLAIPLFMYAGKLMVAGKTTQKLVNFASIFLGRIPGYVGALTVVSSAFYGAVSGSAPATASAIGSMLAPEMKKAGYPRGYTGAVIAASGMLGMLIPPSVPFILLGFSTGISVTDLFIAGIIPGIIMTLMYVLWNVYFVKRSKLALNDTVGSELTSWQKFKGGIWAMVMPILVLGGIYSGIFTPTEAAAVSCVYAMFIGLVVYRGFNLKGLIQATKEAAYEILTLMLGLVFIGIFIRIVTYSNVASLIATFLTSLTSSTVLLLLLVNLFWLIWGMFMDPLAGVLLLGPLFYPLCVTFIGMDPIHYGTMMVVNLGLGVTTPPLAINMYIGMRQSAAPISEVIKHLIPFIILGIVLILLVTFIPEISLVLVK